MEKKKYEYKKQIKIDGVKIPFSKSVKYLGATLGSEINWKLHILILIQIRKNSGHFFPALWLMKLSLIHI